MAEADEDESDLDLAWKMLDVARAIAEKNPGDTMEKVDILSALAEVSLERGLLMPFLFIRMYHFYAFAFVRTMILCFCYEQYAEDIETSLSDYQKALSILERLVEPDSRLIAELYPLKLTVTFLYGLVFSKFLGWVTSIFFFSFVVKLNYIF